MKRKINRKKIYVGFAADILHKGHINVLKTASKLGEVTVGLLTDSAISSYKKFPLLDYKQREIVLKNIKHVKNLPDTFYLKIQTYDYTTDKGMRIRTTAKNGKVVDSFIINDVDQIILVSNKGQIIRVAVNQIGIAGRSTQGVSIFKIPKENSEIHRTNWLRVN